MTESGKSRFFLSRLRQCLLDKLYHRLRTTIRRLVAITSVSIIMDYPYLTDFFFLKSGATRTQWSKADAVTNNAEMLDAFSAC